MAKKEKDKKVLINLRVDLKEREDMKRMADKNQGGNVSRYLRMLHRENVRRAGA
jgi:hypothetical protein